MKVFVLLSHWDDAHSDCVGVFSSREKAVKALYDVMDLNHPGWYSKEDIKDITEFWNNPKNYDDGDFSIFIHEIL